MSFWIFWLFLVLKCYNFFATVEPYKCVVPYKRHLKRNTLSGKKVGKKWRIFFASDEFFADYFFTDEYSYRQIFLPTFFLQTRTFSIF